MFYIQRPFHSSYDGVLSYLNISTLKNRRNYLSIIFLYKLINNNIDCSQILNKINFRIYNKNLRNKEMFLINYVKT